MSLLEEDDAVLDAQFKSARDKAFGWLVDRFQAERKTSVVHGHKPLCVEILECLDRLFGVHVHLATGWCGVRANREQRDLHRAALADFAEAVEVCRIAAMENGTIA